MRTYELMVKTNHYFIKGGRLSEKQQKAVVSQLLRAKCSPEQADRFYNSVTGRSFAKRQIYPLFFIPPYNDGKKLKTILYQSPQTHILSANMYELEILRLLYLLEPGNPAVLHMVMQTLLRLKDTCFGSQEDGIGECFDASLVVLRFLGTVAPKNTEWILDRIHNYHLHKEEKKHSQAAKWYYWLCLSELPPEITETELSKCLEEILFFLEEKSLPIGRERDRLLSPVLFCILRNVISQNTQYSYLKNRLPYISKRDNRLHFDIS